MKLVFQENPKFGDEQDVTQQITAIEEAIEKLLAEIKRFEVNSAKPAHSNIPLSLFQSYISEIERARIPTTSDIDLTSRFQGIYDSDQSIQLQNSSTSSQHRR